MPFRGVRSNTLGSGVVVVAEVAEEILRDRRSDEREKNCRGRRGEGGERSEMGGMDGKSICAAVGTVKHVMRYASTASLLLLLKPAPYDCERCVFSCSIRLPLSPIIEACKLARRVLMRELLELSSVLRVVILNVFGCLDDGGGVGGGHGLR